MRFKNLDLIGVLFLVLANVGWLQLPSHPWFIGILLAVPLTFALPGYALTQALFRRKPAQRTSSLILKPNLNLGRPISSIDYITLSLGLSMAVDILVGFTLNIFPVGLQAQSWILSLGVLTILFTLVALYLRRNESTKSKRILRPPITRSHTILFGLAILVGIAAIGIALVRPPTTQAYFTQFWMLPSSHTTTSCAVTVGIQNLEANTKTYQVIVSMNGAPVSVWQSVPLTPKKTWERLVPIYITGNTNAYIEARLYKVDEPDTVYREVHMTVESKAGSKEDRLCTY